MTEQNHLYPNWRAIELATKEAAKNRAKEAPIAAARQIDAQLYQARFDRFLTRVFAEGEESGWLLKGGLSMLARVPTGRRTTDVDLASGAADLAEARDSLSRVVDVDLGDHMTFRYVGDEETGQGENQPGVKMRRFFFACIDTSTGQERGDRVKVDVVVGPAPVGTPETIEPANRLHLARPLVTHPYRLYPVADQIADKVCATMSSYGEQQKASSRVKDLIDLVLLARSQKVDLDELRLAIATKAGLSKIEPFQHITFPDDWSTTYARQSRGVPDAARLSSAEAQSYVSQLINPALAPSGDAPAVWIPGAGWTDSEKAAITAAEVAADVAAGGDVYVRHHTRDGWQIREHWRAVRGARIEPPHP